MAARARYSSSQAHYDEFDAAGDYAHGELTAGERIGPPLPSRGRRLLRNIAIIALLGGGWALFGEQATQLGRSLADQARTYFASLTVEPTTRAAQPSGTAEPTMRAAALNTLPPAQAPPPLPEAAAKPYTSPMTTASIPPPAKDAEAAAAPLPPPVVDRTDPLQVRAEAVGLHPELSRVLLSRLTAADYRNAGVAIKTAIAETPNGGVLVYPRQRKPELALFQVRFVQGAASGCRRYVVTVTKDGWSTTALPMERCNTQAQPAAARRS